MSGTCGLQAPGKLGQRYKSWSLELLSRSAPVTLHKSSHHAAGNLKTWMAEQTLGCKQDVTSLDFVKVRQQPVSVY
ncbi:hypothetical protein O3P69_006130 [Scylla paramamosain]|uniref:Uncharacterized protein n=1 Tax=Scylla paramamosain TaxID=85552 RepID=A0AAW0U5A6_SCYPA